VVDLPEFPSAGALEAGGGGGSISVGAGEGFDTGSRGSGNDDKASSADEVSIVMFSVACGDVRRVYTMGEHLTTTDGFL
jgi:hypothetical protein